MNRHRARRRTKQQAILRTGVATVAAGALIVTALVFIRTGELPVVADLGKPVAGRSAPKVEAEAKSASWSSQTTKTRHLPKRTWNLELDRSGADEAASSAGPGATSARRAGAWTAVGDTSISVASATSSEASSKGAIRDVTVAVRSQAAAKKQHLQGVVLTLRRSDGSSKRAPVAVRIPKKLLAQQFGADYAARTRWVQIDGKRKYSQTTATPVATKTTASAITLTPFVSSRMMTLAATTAATSSSGTGSFSASSLKESGKWDVSAQTGDFSWEYPITVPPAPGGPSPSLALTYDSQSIDGETGSTNNQPSAIGDGWELGGGGFIERQYVSCSLDDGASGPVKTSGDECWKADNATLSLGGHSAQLVRDSASGVWKMSSDDGSRIEHLVGTAAGCSANGTHDTDCWRVTTTDGTQYYFGKNQLPGWASGKPTTNSTWTVPVFGNDAGEPCHASTFAASSCMQGWRWNLDYVVDVHGNAEALYYDAETNSYAKNGATTTSYTRGGQLDHIDYGLTPATVYAASAAVGRVAFGYDAYGRCSDTTHANCTKEDLSAAATKPAKPASYPDVPWDQFCTSACTANKAPTFWTDGMLNTITASVKSGSSYAAVDKWTLSHSFPAPGDGTTAALWMTQVQHTGYQGSASASTPPVKFNGVRMQNRVWAVDGLAPLDKLRISSITAETGAVTSVNYSAQDCTAAEADAIEKGAATNSRRCYPQWWSPDITPPQEPKLDLFHKYVVMSVVDDPRTGGGADRPVETSYDYTGTPAWRYNSSPTVPVKKRTWSLYAGYDTVEVHTGSASDPAAQGDTEYTFYRGLDGDRAGTSGGQKSVDVSGAPGVTDSAWLAGQTRRTVVRNGVGGAVVSDTESTPWVGAVEADDGADTARMVRDGSERMSEPLANGGTRTRTTVTTSNDDGNPTQVAVSSSDAGSTCTTTSYVPNNTSAWIIGLPLEQKSVGTACGGGAPAPRDVVSDQRTSYDGAAIGATPTKGDPTQVQQVTGFSGSDPVWTTTATKSYDAIGRELSSKDALGRATTTSYSPSTGGPVTSTTSVNPKGWKSTAVTDPGRGSVTSFTDFDGSVTTADYDALGRRAKVWLPGHAKADNPTTPNYAFAYTETPTAPLAVATTTLNSTGTTTGYVLSDGLGRQVQSQDPSGAGGSIVTDVGYDDQGRSVSQNNAYWASGTTPSATLFVPVSQQQVQSSEDTSYDAVGRPTAVIARSYAKERSRATTRYLGADEVDVVPPSGGTPSSTFSNSIGQKTVLRQYLGGAIGASAPHQDTTYGYDARGDLTSMIDPAGNKWSWTYDVTGKAVATTDPDAGTTTSVFDAVGNETSTTDARGVTLATSYDELNRATALRTGSSTGPLVSSWSFDTVKVGQLSSATRYVGSTASTPGIAYTTSVTGYDGGNRPTGQTLSVPEGAPAFAGTSYTTKTAYTADGSVGSYTTPAIGGLAAERLSYTYNALGEVSSLSGIKSYAGLTYDALNRLTQTTRDGTVPNTSSYTRDPLTGDVIGIQDQTGTGSSTVTQAKRTYTRNDVGAVTSASTVGAAGAETQCYKYDSLLELTSAWTPSDSDCAASPTAQALGGPSPYWVDYSYDKATGNRTSATTHGVGGTADEVDTYHYGAPGSARPHAVQSVDKQVGGETTSEGFEYDAAGDTTARGTAALEYDATAKVTSISDGAQSQSTVYDASGNQLLQVDPKDGATLFLGDIELHQANGSSTTTATRTYSIAGTAVAERDATALANTVYALDTDVDGTVDLETNVLTGEVTRRWFTPFGEQRGGASSWTSNHGFLNQSASSFTDLTHLGARAYDPSLGKFLSVDSVLNPDQPQQNNGYSYSGNNPVSNPDVSGMCPAWLCALTKAINKIVKAVRTIVSAINNWLRPSTQVSSGHGRSYSAWSGHHAVAASSRAPTCTWGATCGIGISPPPPKKSNATTPEKWVIFGSAAALGAVFLACLLLTEGLCGFAAPEFGAAEGSVLAGDLATTATVEGSTATAGDAAAAEGAAASARGWKLGDDVNALTKAGNKPAWSTIRGRTWKNEAANPELRGYARTPENLARMKAGKAPQRFNFKKGDMESLELSHEPVPQRDGGTEFVPRWPEEHAAIDPFRHINY
ncbi:RHS repeat domain-containing protein [Curtobacterium flaccumfaciens]|uniref:RHS repeat domain-containing protein n=1 Tax=Curtobacterium flaccumfaciens TaxID=2035 RepID=UPI001BDFE838|nr:RHS repeat-associated core domain-containing protein [Curtobacterium flaccumfaciens]MBT1585226.1 hypothetical protein [Curtobacterium flaccumfaciens pv. flaccumfaciens]MCX2798226.1 hypothetical protein [Curtobacterium flaccumfaciens pv. flaccumfaciens]